MAAWTDERKKEAVDAYQAQNPTPETSIEICKQIAEDMDETPNGVRLILCRAGVYLKKEAGVVAESTVAKASGSTKRVSKEDSIAALVNLMKDMGLEVDEDIVSKLTGKAAIYFHSVLSSVKK